MSSNSQKTAGDDRNLVNANESRIPLTPDEQFRLFWEKNGRFVIIAAFLLALLFVGYRVYGHIAASRDAAVRNAYAAAKTNIELRDFIAANGSHPLVGVALVRVADEAYAANNYQTASENYAAAIPLLAQPILRERARLGLAVSLVQRQLVKDGEKLLEALLSDPAVSAPVRQEAGCVLLSSLIENGHAADAARVGKQVLAIEPSGALTQRASQLLSTLPPAETAAP
ncbi:MAG: tetratricopeptide repeat protein [Opitutaceae bacterium]|jgi:predicted negative regulator of RcsB-dependent stress response|nr:tetratricopeptide repeat protein [Opitutaceae bacterium]